MLVLFRYLLQYVIMNSSHHYLIRAIELCEVFVDIVIIYMCIYVCEYVCIVYFAVIIAFVEQEILSRYTYATLNGLDEYYYLW